MGKHRNDMKKIHRKTIKQAKEQLGELEKRNTSFNNLNRFAKKIFYKRLNAGYEFPAKAKSIII